MLYELMQQYAAVNAAAGNWSAVIATLADDSLIQKQATKKAELADVLSVLTQAEAEATLTAFAATEIGLSGRRKLESQGLDFRHPLTIALIDGLEGQGALPAGVADKLKRLGQWTVSPLAEAGIEAPTEAELQAAWLAGQLRTEWAAALNDSIEPALAISRPAVIAALRTVADSLEG